MADRDLDALEAHKASLDRSVDAKTAERNEAVRLLAEARGDRGVPRSRDHRRRTLLIGAVLISVVGSIGVARVLWRRDASNAELVARAASGPLTCDDIEPDHAATERATQISFEAARDLRGYRTVSLERRSTAQRERLDDVDKELGHAAIPWKQFTFETAGAHLSAVVGEVHRYDTGAEPPEFVADAHDGVWRVIRAPRFHPVRSLRVTACAWGCWGSVPSGVEPPQTLSRDIWILPPGSTYRGETTIAFDAPSLEISYIHQDCPLPP